MIIRQKRILQVVGAMNMGGAETFLMNIFRDINREKYQFIFLCYIDGAYDYEDEIRKLGGKIVRIPDTRITNPVKFTKNIEKVIRYENINIVHSHVDFSSGYSMLAAKNAGIKTRIVHAHNTSATWSKNIIKNVWFKFLKLLMNHYSTNRIACGMNAGKFMFGKKAFKVIHNGIDIKRFRYSATDRTKIRHQLKINMNDTVFLHVGRFEAAKNHNFLIEIFNTYYASNPTAKLILLGDGSLFNTIKKKVSEFGLNDAVYMLGKKTNTEDYYSASDLFIMPSFYEGFPVTLVEAQVNGLACLVGDTIDKTVKYGVVDFYPLEKNATKWAKHAQKINYDHKPTDSLLAKEYDAKKVTNLLKELYESK